MAELTSGGTEELAEALGELGVGVEHTKEGVVLDVDGRRSGPWAVRVVGTVTPAQAASLADEVDGRQFLVANRTYTAAVDRLAAAGVGYYGLDSGRLVLRGDGLRIDRTVPRPAATGILQSHGPALTLRGRAGIVIAYELLDHPTRPLSPRRDAERLDLSSSSISLALRTLDEHGLLDDDGRPLTPELFLELAGVWRPDRTWLASPPDPDTVRGPVTASGPAAASAWGAPIIASEDTLNLYVATEADARLAVRRLGPAPPGTTPWTIATPLARQACRPPDDGPTVGGFAAAPVLAVALDLSTDPARGAQVLDEWTPDPEVHARVW